MRDSSALHGGRADSRWMSKRRGEILDQLMMVLIGALVIVGIALCVYGCCVAPEKSAGWTVIRQ